MKSALITGANKGIGLESARLLLKKGYFVLLGCRSYQSGLEASAVLQAEGLDQVDVVQLDVTDNRSIEEAKSHLGKKIKKLDVLINNAGVNGGVPLLENGEVAGFKKATNTSVEIFQEVFDTNLYGVIRVTQAFLDLMRKAPAPRIVNVSSSSGSLTLHSDPNWWAYSHKDAAYLPSKSALNMYTIVLAYDLKDTAFKVNAVDPGFTSTDFNNHNGTGSAQVAAERIVKYAIVDSDGPTGKFFSEEYNSETGNIPW
jgi:NAD(P)-dependent dehydrogenase (short-subunit alcohol dehydrogenase family)